MLTRGDRLGARFRLIDKVGEGGMGVVWLARDERLDCDVALKVLHAALLGDEHSAARLRNEARAAAKIAHPGICRVLDVGEHEDTPFLVMELLRGQSLAALIEHDKRLSPEVALSVVEPVLEALAAAHAEGVLHRDMKPENVFLCEDGSVKVLDFGVAKILDDGARERLTRTGALIGTPAYMAPEQARGLPSDERADLWSVGVMLYEMLVGALPFTAPNYQGMLVAIATSAAPSVRARCSSLDAGLAAIVDRALHASLAERWPDARSFSSALAEWRAANGVARASVSTSPGASSRRTPRRSPREQAILTMTDPDRQRRRRGRLALVVAAVTIVTVALSARRLFTPAVAASAAAVSVGDAGFARDARASSEPPDVASPPVVVADRAQDASPRDASAASDVVASDAPRPRPRRGRRADGGASAGIGRDPDF